MAKSVFGSHIQLAHVWAQGRVDSGRAYSIRSSDGRMFAEGRILYSYGTHFALGVVVTSPTGEVVATFLNDSGYSPSTGKHKGHARHAARGAIHYIPNLTEIARAISELSGGRDSDELFKARAREELARHIQNHYAMTEAAAGALCALAGGTAKQAAALQAKGAKAAAKAFAEGKKRERDLALGKGKTWAAMSLEAFRAAWREHVGTSAYDAPRRAKGLTSELRALHKVASANGLTARKVKLWGMVKLSQEMEEQASAAAIVANKGRYLKAAIRTIRQYIANANAPAPRPLTSSQWRQVEEAAGVLEKRAYGHATLDAMGTAAMVLKGQAYDARHVAQEAEQEAARIEREERDRLRKAGEEANRAAWFEGNPAAQLYETTPAGGVYLRALHVERDDSGAIVGGVLQTSRGADVPLAHALKAFRFIKLCRAKGQAWQANGRTVPVGHFRIDSIATNGDFKAGCHFIEWEEVAKLAKALGVEGWQGDESAVVTSEHA